MLRRAFVTALSIAALPAAAAEPATHRALVADHVNGKLTLIELPSGKAAHYAVEGPARLKASADGRLIFLTQGAQGRVDVLDSGVAVGSHGDHFDAEITTPRMLESHFAGGKPSHVNEAEGLVAVFFDESGTAQAAETKALLSGKARFAPVKADRPHHGLAAPLPGHFAVSLSREIEGRAVAHGVEVAKRGGGVAARSEECPRLHGEARIGAVSAFGCADGVLLLTEAKGRFAFEKLGYPESLPKERMVRNLAGSRNVRSFLGDFGADGMVVIDPAAKSFAFVALPARRIAFGRDPLNGERGYVVTEDGRLHRLNALTGKLEDSVAVTERYATEGAIARPRVSASGGMVVVTDPARAKAHVVDGESLRLIRSIDVPGAPFDVAVVGARAGAH